MMKKLLITQCRDSMRWYSGMIGQTVPYLGDMGDEYKSREPSGYINFVQYQDSTIINTSNNEIRE